MSRPQDPQPAKLVIGVFLQIKALFKPVMIDLINFFGPLDIISPWFSFHQTEYYKKEMGSPLFRRILSFNDLIRQEDLSNIKVETNGIESKYSESGHRRVNIDPGYLLRERFVLATGKNFSHRIYIGNCVYADLTLVFQKGQFHALPWTYPDYQEPDIQDFLHQARNKYSWDLNETNSSGTKQIGCGEQR